MQSTSTPTSSCDRCGGRGEHLIAALSDPHYLFDAKGKRTITHTRAIPIIVPCKCRIERAAKGLPT